MGVTKPGRWALRDPRWPALRIQALRRDDFRCRHCGQRGRLEVDHIKPVTDYPALAFALDNLQSLCGPCHGEKTRREMGLQRDPERSKWMDLVRQT